MTTTLETIREDQALGAAWRRCEAALPEGYLPSVEPWLDDRIVGRRDDWHYMAHGATPAVGGMRYTTREGYGPTPTVALEALAERLEALR